MDNDPTSYKVSVRISAYNVIDVLLANRSDPHYLVRLCVNCNASLTLFYVSLDDMLIMTKHYKIRGVIVFWVLIPMMNIETLRDRP